MCADVEISIAIDNREAVARCKELTVALSEVASAAIKAKSALSGISIGNDLDWNKLNEFVVSSVRRELRERDYKIMKQSAGVLFR